MTRIKSWLDSLHLPSLVAGIVALAVAQVSVSLAPGWLTIAGNPIDFSSPAGRDAALMVILAVLVRAIQGRTAAAGS